MCFVHNSYKLYLNVFSSYIYYTELHYTYLIVYSTIKKKKKNGYNIKFNYSSGKLCVEICKFAKICKKKKTFKVLILLGISIL